MQYYYNIDLCFNDELIESYNWTNLDHIIRAPIIKIKDIKNIILYNGLIDTDYRFIIFTDGISNVVVEVVNYRIAYLSYLNYKDDLKVLEIASRMKTSKDIIKYTNERIKLNKYKKDVVKKVFINEILNNNKYFIKYLYYQITNTIIKDINIMKLFLLNDIKCNFSVKYINIYEIIVK